jgi:hypothetical protein
MGTFARTTNIRWKLDALLLRVGFNKRKDTILGSRIVHYHFWDLFEYEAYALASMK